MAEMIQFDLVSPERRLASVQARQVQLPGAEGDMTALPDHAPMITALRPGVLTVSGPEGEDAYAVTGGFAEIVAESVTVLAERALHVSEVTPEVIEGFVADARAALERAQENGDHSMADDAAKLLADMVAMGDHIRMG